MAKLSNMIGRTFVDVVVSEDEITFMQADGSKWVMHHYQDCCESVTIDDICGDTNDLIGAPILVAEERIESGDTNDDFADSCTWSFYEFATINGSVTIRWYGTSNGYYSERVDIEFEDHLLKNVDRFTKGYLEQAAFSLYYDDFDSAFFTPACIMQALTDCSEVFNANMAQALRTFDSAMIGKWFFCVRNNTMPQNNLPKPLAEAAALFGPWRLELKHGVTQPTTG